MVSSTTLSCSGAHIGIGVVQAAVLEERGHAVQDRVGLHNHYGDNDSGDGFSCLCERLDQNYPIGYESGKIIVIEK